jgi:hypothetical protein
MTETNQPETAVKVDKPKKPQPVWDNKPLSKNYFRYVELQKAIEHAQHWEQTERLPELIKAVQEPARKLTRYEKEYSRWVLPLYTDPKEKINIYKLTCEIRALAMWLKEGTPITARTTDLPEQFHLPGGDYWSSKKYWGHDDYVQRYTRLCALRASMRGRMHFSPNTRMERLTEFYDIDVSGDCMDLEAQREWVSDIAWEFAWAREEEKEKAVKIIGREPAPKPKDSRGWLHKLIDRLLGFE